MADPMEDTTKKHEAPKHLSLLLSGFAVFVLIGAGLLAWTFIHRTGKVATPAPVATSDNRMGGQADR